VIFGLGKCILVSGFGSALFRSVSCRFLLPGSQLVRLLRLSNRQLTVWRSQHTMNRKPSMAEPVFYDPQRARWKRLRRFVDAAVAVLSALIIFFGYTTLRDEHLPELLFSPQKRAFKA
jgi:hypothetical protein